MSCVCCALVIVTAVCPFGQNPPVYCGNEIQIWWYTVYLAAMPSGCQRCLCPWWVFVVMVIVTGWVKEDKVRKWISFISSKSRHIIVLANTRKLYIFRHYLRSKSESFTPSALYHNFYIICSSKVQQYCFLKQLNPLKTWYSIICTIYNLCQGTNESQKPKGTKLIMLIHFFFTVKLSRPIYYISPSSNPTIWWLTCT